MKNYKAEIIKRAISSAPQAGSQDYDNKLKEALTNNIKAVLKKHNYSPYAPMANPQVDISIDHSDGIIEIQIN
jgi:hypothetical protein